ncbi:hypothetical protein NX059_003294 [Plenodomus lindquistii]|nr:hypothetical protein NX059_003294 [Plenodomus lindquistii]
MVHSFGPRHLPWRSSAPHVTRSRICIWPIAGGPLSSRYSSVVSPVNFRPISRSCSALGSRTRVDSRHFSPLRFLLVLCPPAVLSIHQLTFHSSSNYPQSKSLLDDISFCACDEKLVCLSPITPEELPPLATHRDLTQLIPNQPLPVMPAERRQFQPTRPVKTERTHEENQERAYIAASRRSDRSLEARIESARRASEIHKRRTGRGLRVTEQDVINEEMYEEEDDDLPTQYQRLNAHLHTTSVMFNKKLHDYIATQHGVRNMFMSQYNTPAYQQGGGPSAGAMPQAQANNWLNPSMLPPQQFSPTLSQGFQQEKSYSPAAAPQQGFRQSPYYIPQRSQPHQRSLSIQMPPAANFDAISQQMNSSATTPHGEMSRRMSLPPQAFQQQVNTSVEVKPQQLALSQSQSPVLHQSSTSSQTASPTAGSVYQSPHAPAEAGTPTSFTYSPGTYPYSSQALNSNPLTMSMPPESQQFIGSAMDPTDTRTALFMSGSENLPQPFAPTYTYNPNPKPRMASSPTNEKSAGSAQTLSHGLNLKLENDSDAVSSNLTSISEGFYNNDSFLTPGNGDYNAFFDFSTGDNTLNGEGHGGGTDQFDGSNLVDWD